MANLHKDHVFQLVKSLGKGEKRNFKLYMQRNSANTVLKVVQLFDALDGLTQYDESTLLKRQTGISKPQLSNLKASLYKHILASLRLIKDSENIDMELHEMLDHARLLYNKGFYLQSIHQLNNVKVLAKEYSQMTLLQQALFFEKKIEAMYITRSMASRADTLTREANEVQQILERVNTLTNLSLLLYSWFIKHGHARNQQDFVALDTMLQTHLGLASSDLAFETFYERLNYYQCFCWYYFIKLDYLNYYRFAKKWVGLFEADPKMKMVETIQYIKGLHNLISAYYDARKWQLFEEALQVLSTFYETDWVQKNTNYAVQAFIYLYSARIQDYFLKGQFTKGLEIVPEVLRKLETYEQFIDEHRVLIFYYKIASLYFGSGHPGKCIAFLNKIIQTNSDLRTDLQCYSRLLHLIAHYELGHQQLLPYLIKSVYRYMANLENMNHVEEEVFAFLRQALQQNDTEIRASMQRLLTRLQQLEANVAESRAFAYLDIVSWLQSKLQQVPVEIIIRQKFLMRKEKTKPTIGTPTENL